RSTTFAILVRLMLEAPHLLLGPKTPAQAGRNPAVRQGLQATFQRALQDAKTKEPLGLAIWWFRASRDWRCGALGRRRDRARKPGRLLVVQHSSGRTLSETPTRARCGR